MIHDDYARLPHGSKVLFESDVVQIGATRCPHWHADFERPGPIQRHAFYLGGSPVRIVQPDGQLFLADSTSVSFHNRGEEPERRSVAGHGDFSNWFALAPDYLLSALESLDPGRQPDPEQPFGHTHARCPDASFALQRLLVQSLQSDAPPDALTAEESALRLFEDLARGALAQEARPAGRRAETRRRHLALVEAVKEVLVDRFRTSLDLAQIAKEVDCSPYHLARVFRACTGWTLHGYRHQIRLRKAFDALLQGEDDLSRLATRLGFSNHSHLTSCFRSAFDLSPSALRERGRPPRRLGSRRGPGRLRP